MIRRLALGIAGFGAACVAYGTLLEAHAYVVRRHTVPILPPGSHPIRILHLSDIHLLPGQTRKRTFLSGLAGLEPDLVVNTGDNISAANAIRPLLASLGRLREVPGVFVFGSNDYEAPQFKLPVRYLLGSSRNHVPARAAGSLPTESLRAAFTDLGWVDLNNQTGSLTLKGRRIAFRGTGDAHENRDDYARVAGATNPDTLEIGVTHAPYRRVLDAMTADGLELILAGHTHGGQVCLPGRGALVTNCDLPTDRASGLFTHDADGNHAYVNVSAGIGMSPFAPYRFACPPEVSLLTLNPQPAPM
ncbi:MAG: metallophosphoesterase [Propioniciclava sp.]